jgi:hypothetical protein
VPSHKDPYKDIYFYLGKPMNLWPERRRVKPIFVAREVFEFENVLIENNYLVVS